MTELSPHFTLEELTVSQEASRKGIDNTPTPEIVEALTETCRQAENVRALLGAPMLVSSGYRSVELNAAIGGAEHSAHCLGHAMDFICPAAGNPLEICQKIKASGIQLDQCINEGAHAGSLGWVHLSFDPRYRMQFMTAAFTPEGATYKEGLIG